MGRGRQALGACLADELRPFGRPAAGCRLARALLEALAGPRRTRALSIALKRVFKKAFKIALTWLRGPPRDPRRVRDSDAATYLFIIIIIISAVAAVVIVIVLVTPRRAARQTSSPR